MDFHNESHSFHFSEGFTLIHLASRNGHLNVVKFLVEFGVDVNQQTVFRTWFGPRSSTPLLVATENGHIGDEISYRCWGQCQSNRQNWSNSSLHCVTQTPY